MALHYVLDGYNVIHQLPPLADLGPEDSRTGLIRMLQTLQPQGSFRNEVTVVFDGQTVNVPPQSPGIRVLFSYEETADDVIKRLVDDAKNVRSLVVITDDRAIRYYSRAAGAGIKSVKEFFGSMKVKTSGPGTSDRKTISQSQEYGITQEMAQIWLRKKKDNKDQR